MYDEQRGSDLIQLAAFINRERKPLEYFQELRVSNYFFYATNPSSPAEGKQRFKAFNYSKNLKILNLSSLRKRSRREINKTKCFKGNKKVNH